MAYLDSTEGLICKSLASILGAATNTKICPSGEYLAGFDTGAGDDTEDGAFRCRPDAQGVSGGVTVSCGVDQYVGGFAFGTKDCRTLPAPASTRLSSIGKCAGTDKYLAGFNSSGGRVCLTIPRGADGGGRVVISTPSPPGPTPPTPTTGHWTQTLKISDNGGGDGKVDVAGLDNNDLFGRSFSLSADNTLMAASAESDDDGGTNKGAVYLFQKTGSAWSQIHKFSDHTTRSDDATRFTTTKTDVNLDNNDRFGSGVSLSGNLLAVGAHAAFTGTLTHGAVYLFEKQTNGKWRQIHKFSDHTTSTDTATRFTTSKTDIDLVGTSTYGEFGRSVFLSGNLLAVGAKGSDSYKSNGGIIYNTGAVYLFEKQTGGKWLQVHKFSNHTTSSDETIRFTTTQTNVSLRTEDHFGAGVSLSANGLLLAVGAQQQFTPSNRRNRSEDMGMVFLFEKQTSGKWSQVHKFSNHTTSSDEAIRFTTTETDVNLDNNDGFGKHVFFSGNRLAVGVERDDDGGTNRGAVYLFEKQTNGKWSQIHKFSDHTTSTNTATRFTATKTDINLDNGDGLGYGTYLSADGNLMAVGAGGDADGGTGRGAVYLFSRQ